MTIIYNDIEPYACRWLHNLVMAGHIAPGIVDSRSIEQVDGISGDAQFHTFAGIGVWSLALRMANIPDDFPVWTGSCPCQPFSVAGEQKGTDDERHLFPAWLTHIAEHLPPIIFGEQVASPAGRTWLDDVSTALEALGYAVGSADLCAAGVGAPHIRQRLFFGAARLADSRLKRLEGYAGDVHHLDEPGRFGSDSPGPVAPPYSPDGLVDAGGERLGIGELLLRSIQQESGGEDMRLVDADNKRHPIERLLPEERGPQTALPEAVGHDQAGRMGNPDSVGSGRERSGPTPTQKGDAGQGDSARCLGYCFEPSDAVVPMAIGVVGVDPGATKGFWGRSGWLLGRDGGIRPVRPGTFPLVDGTPQRVGRLRAYGNSIVPQVAAEFVASFVEAVLEQV